MDAADYKSPRHMVAEQLAEGIKKIGLAPVASVTAVERNRDGRCYIVRHLLPSGYGETLVFSTDYFKFSAIQHNIPDLPQGFTRLYSSIEEVLSVMNLLLAGDVKSVLLIEERKKKERKRGKREKRTLPPEPDPIVTPDFFGPLRSDEEPEDNPWDAPF